MIDPVLTCTQWDTTTQTCLAQAWVELPSIFGKLPSLHDAGEIGAAMMIAVCAVAAASLLIPSTKGYSDE